MDDSDSGDGDKELKITAVYSSVDREVVWVVFVFIVVQSIDSGDGDKELKITAVYSSVDRVSSMGSFFALKVV